MFWGKKIPQINTDEKLIEDVLTRSISVILPEKEDLKKILLSGKRLKIYAGMDATGPDLHLGHSTVLITLEKFRRLGHDVTILFGDFTAMIGDPTDKGSVRKKLTEQEVEKNLTNWENQIKKVLKTEDKNNPAKIVRNSGWLKKLSFGEIIEIASNFTVQHMLQRDMFEKRLKEGSPVFLHEFFYPIMQGYDSVVLNVDLEVGGTDQTFNMLAGRILQKKINGKEKFVIAKNLLENPETGKKLMSKSEGDYISLNLSPNDMYGKVMSVPDNVVTVLYENCTFVSKEDVEILLNEVRSQTTHPKDVKMKVAKEIVKTFYNEELAKKAEENFTSIFSNKEIPDEMPEVFVIKNTKIIDVVVDSKTVSSKGDFRRLVDEGAITVLENGEVLKDTNFLIQKEMSLKIGKKRFLKIKIK